MEGNVEERGSHSSLSVAGRAFVSWMNRNNFDIHPNVQLRYIDSYQAHSVIASGPIEVRLVPRFYVERRARAMILLCWCSNVVSRSFGGVGRCKAVSGTEKVHTLMEHIKFEEEIAEIEAPRLERVDPGDDVRGFAA